MVFSILILGRSPPQRILLVNTSERKNMRARALAGGVGYPPRALIFPLSSLRAPRVFSQACNQEASAEERELGMPMVKYSRL